MSSTAIAARKNARGVARPTRPAVPCGLMFAAMLGAIRATEMPTACHTDRLGRSPRRLLPGAVLGLVLGAAMTPPAGRPETFRMMHALPRFRHTRDHANQLSSRRNRGP